MTVKSVPSHKAWTQLFEGLSSDTKPSVNVDPYALFIENDTGNIFQYTGASWQAYTRGGSIPADAILETGTGLSLVETTTGLSITETGPDDILSEMIGYAAFAGTTGGAGYDLIEVTSTADTNAPGTLRWALDQAEAAGGGWIRLNVSGRMTSSKNIHLVNNVTIDGRGVEFVIDGIASIKGYNFADTESIDNWILLNFSLETTGTNSAISTRYSADKYWIHHMNISGGTDDTVTITNSERGKDSRGTISYTRWDGVDKALLAGDLVADIDENEIKLTLHHSYINGFGQRGPTAAYADLHCYNNLIEDWTVTATASVAETDATILHESSYFISDDAGSAVAFNGIYSPADVGHVSGATRGENNVLDAGTETCTESEVTPGLVITPSYTYVPDLANSALKVNVENQSGATLSVYPA